ncbi:hypothetical protein GAY29_16105 [Azospirillum brasilense]|nr:hypothetical protein [Azospirillum brasilense]
MMQLKEILTEEKATLRMRNAIDTPTCGYPALARVAPIVAEQTERDGSSKVAALAGTTKPLPILLMESAFTSQVEGSDEQGGIQEAADGRRRGAGG